MTNSVVSERTASFVVQADGKSFALGDQHCDVILLFVRAEASNRVHERGKQVRQGQVAMPA
jgi:hypothetical protein